MKIALLIGVSTYQLGLTPLPSAEKDIQALRRVLEAKEMGGFNQVKPLVNPDPFLMQSEIEELFADRNKDDLLLLFYSGHGIKDDSGKLYFATCLTKKSPTGELQKSTAVPASFVQEIMSNSRSRRQVVMLDCCYSGAFAEGLNAKDDGKVDIQKQLGGEGRAVLTSSTSTQYSFEQQGDDLSVFTRYVVEGIETGASDEDNDGDIAIDELHEYAKRRVRETAPAMKPEIFAVKEGFTIKLARAQVGDPKLRYRREVERCADCGVISDIARRALDARIKTLGLSPEEAKAIEAEVLKPHLIYRGNLWQYERTFLEAITREYPISPKTRDELDYLKHTFGLRDEDVAPTETQILTSREILAGGSALQSSDNGSDAIPIPPQTSAVGAVAASAIPTPQLLTSLHPASSPSARSRQNRWLLNIALICTIATSAVGGYWGVLWWRSEQQQQLALQQQETILQQSLDAASKAQWQEAIAQASQITATSSLYPKAQFYVHEWSDNLLEQATQEYNRGNFDAAIQIAQAIPLSTTVHTKAQIAIGHWQQEWASDTQSLSELKQQLSSQPVLLSNIDAAKQIGQALKHPVFQHTVMLRVGRVFQRLQSFGIAPGPPAILRTFAFDTNGAKNCYPPPDGRLGIPQRNLELVDDRVRRSSRG